MTWGGIGLVLCFRTELQRKKKELCYDILIYRDAPVDTKQECRSAAVNQRVAPCMAGRTRTDLKLPLKLHSMRLEFFVCLSSYPNAPHGVFLEHPPA